MTDMKIIIKTAAELRPGDTYVVGVTPLDIRNGTLGTSHGDFVTVVAVGLSYIDRYGDRYVPMTLADRWGTRVVDKPADCTHNVLEGDA